MGLFSLPDFKQFLDSFSKEVSIFFLDPPFHICYLGFRSVLYKRNICFVFPLT